MTQLDEFLNCMTFYVDRITPLYDVTWFPYLFPSLFNCFINSYHYWTDLCEKQLSPFYTTKFSLANFMCQMYFDCVNEEFLTNLSKNPNLQGQKTFDI